MNKTIDYRHFICLGFVFVSLLCTVFFFPYALGRLCETFVDLGTSAIYYFNFVANGECQSVATVTQRTAMPFVLAWNFPNSWEEFAEVTSKYFDVFFSAENFNAYLEHVADVLLYVSKSLLILLPFFASAILIYSIKNDVVSNDYNKDSKALRRWKKFVQRVYEPCKRWLVNFVQFVKEHGFWWKLTALIWAFNFNFFAIIVDFIAFYLYFVASFRLSDLYGQAVKLLFDLGGMFDFFPGVVWIAVVLLIVNKIRRNIGYKNLEHMELMNRGFLNERPIVVMSCGTMGKGKTTFLTSAGISWEVMFRDKALELLLDTDMKFPHFPWINFELALRKAMDNHTVYNLATCRRFVGSKRRRFEKRPCMQNIFAYNYEKYGRTYVDGLKVTDVWKALEDYAQLYFIYVVQCSLLLSNYSVRCDNVFDDVGNFPVWDTDLFRRRPELQEVYSTHSHILDFDMLRLGKKMIENNKYANCFEFGLVLITEIGKERGNTLENKGKKKDDNEANQLNDLFNSELKMIRHAGSVCGYCFVRVLLDEQRPTSWGADGTELADVLRIRDKTEMNLAMPLFHLEDLLLGVILDKFQQRYVQYRYKHGNNTLLMHLYKGLCAGLYNYRRRVYNQFGYFSQIIRVCDGTDLDDFTDKQYYIMYAKDYCDRFASDAYSDFYVTKSLNSNYGLVDVPSYQKTKASVDEFAQQHSYFMNDLFGGLFGNENK